MGMRNGRMSIGVRVDVHADREPVFCARGRQALALEFQQADFIGVG